MKELTSEESAAFIEELAKALRWALNNIELIVCADTVSAQAVQRYNDGIRACRAALAKAGL